MTLDDASFDPDYTATVEEVYLGFAANLTHRDQTLMLLHFAGIGLERNLTLLPSWIPDWSKFSSASSSAFMDLSLIAGYTASGNRLPIISDISAGTITVTDRLLEKITHTLPQEPPVRHHDIDDHLYLAEIDEYLAWRETAAELFRRLEPYHTSEAWVEVMWRTLQANLSSWDNRLRPSSAEDFQEFRPWMIFVWNFRDQVLIEHGGLSDEEVDAARQSDKSLLQNIVGPLPPTRTVSGDLTPETAKRLSNYGSARGTFRRRSTFSTSGGYAGLGPPLVEKNDTVGASSMVHVLLSFFGPRMTGRPIAWLENVMFID